MSLKEYFEKRKKQKEAKVEQNKLEKLLTKDKKEAQEILNNFKFVIRRTPKNGDKNGTHRRIIDEHNIEYCFIPEIWKIFSMSQKMAIMIKFSQKHNKYPLTLDDFCLPTEKYKQEENIMHIQELVGVDKLVVDYDETKMSKALSVLTSLLSYEDMMKEIIFKRNLQNYNSVLDFKSIEELKYMINGKEKLFATYFTDSLLKDSKLLAKAVYQYENNIENRATLQAIDIMENVSYYAPEAQHIVNFCEAYYNYWTKEKIFNTKNAFGSEDNLKKQTIKFVYDLFNKDDSIDLQTALNHFMPMKEQKLEGSILPHIDLPTREQQKKELSKLSLEF